MITIYHFNDKAEKQSLSDYSQSHLEARRNIIRSDSVPHKSHCVPKILTPLDVMINLDLKHSTWDQDLLVMETHRQ